MPVDEIFWAMAGSDESWSLLDADGNLFGLVNVVDAVVVVLLVGIVAAGAVSVLGPAESQDGPTETRYATISYTAPLDSSAATLAPSDSVTALGSTSNMTVTDTYYSFAPNGSAHVVARVQYRGQLRISGQYRYGGENASIRMDDYRVRAAVLAVDQRASTLATRPVSVTISASEPSANTLEAGQQIRYRNTTVGTVESVGGTESGSGRTAVTLRLEGRERETAPSFGGQSLLVGNTVTVVTDDAVVSGQITAVQEGR